MRLFHFLASALLAGTSLAAGDPAQRFSTFYTKQRSMGRPLQINDEIYAELTAAPRDYSIAIVLTATDDRFGCQMCRLFAPEWDLLASQWMKGDKDAESRLMFATMNFNDGKNTFAKLGLQTAPILLLFEPTTGRFSKADGQPYRYDFSTGVSTAEPIHAWLSRNLRGRPHPPFSRPFNFLKIIVIVTLSLGLITFGTVAAPYIIPLVQNRNLWAAISLILVLLFTSGHMYNQIRGVPYIATDQKGKITYFAAGFQSQLGMETQLVAAIYGVLAFASISLALKVPRMSDPKMQQIAVAAWSAVLLVTYSYLMSIFKYKNGGYPFWLPPFP